MFRASGRTRLPIVLLPVTVFAMGCGFSPQAYDHAALVAFRSGREATLAADDGWLTVSGLHFLGEGRNTFGSGSENDIVLPGRTVPARGGVITLDGTTVAIQAVEGTELILNGDASPGGPLRLARDDRPADQVSYGDVSFFLHYSGPRLAIRVRDQQAVLRTDFKGLTWFAPDPDYRVVGQFQPRAEGAIEQAPNILGDLEPFAVAGDVTFELHGVRHTMEAWQSGQQLWFVMRDRTSTDLTYPAARFLYTDPPGDDGTLVMDFNYARNPPCAYNPWTTCPLPPVSNRLSVRVEAGEQRYHDE